MESNFRQGYDKQISKLFLIIGFMHIPIFILMSFYFKTELSVAIGLTTFIMLGPLLSYKFGNNFNVTKNLIGFSMMCLSAIMIHMGKGMIEMHFHIFITLATLIIFGNALPIIVALATIAIHHIGFFFLLSKSLFNYEAGFEMVLIHAGFAIFQSACCIFIAKKYGNFIKAQDEIMTNLKETSRVNLELAAQVSSISNETRLATDEQAGSIQQTMAALDEITALAHSNTNNIKDTAQNTKNSVQEVGRGKSAVVETKSSLTEISGSNKDMIKTLNDNSKEISEITDVIKLIAEKTKVIDDIVFQTKLLSFNASVEAARAGEHGKGFAVVAEEVGNLANMSGSASSEINELIESSLSQVNKILEGATGKVEALTAQGERVLNEGHKRSEESLSVLESVVSSMNSNQSLMEQITNASNEQLQGMNDISSAIGNLDHLNSSNKSKMDDLSNLSENLDLRAKELAQVINNVEKLLSGQSLDTKVKQVEQSPQEDISLDEDFHFDDVA